MKAKFILSEKKALEQLEIMKSLSDEVSYSVKTNLEVAKILENKFKMMGYVTDELILDVGTPERLKMIEESNFAK